MPDTDTKPRLSMLGELSSVAVSLQGRACDLNWIVVAVNGESGATLPKSDGQS